MTLYKFLGAYWRFGATLCQNSAVWNARPSNYVAVCARISEGRSNRSCGLALFSF